MANATERRIYGAIPSRATPKTWIVAYQYANPIAECPRGWHPMGSVRGFSAFEAADECAQRIASGEFSDWPAGQYVNMR